jgi:plasmid stability protein
MAKFVVSHLEDVLKSRLKRRAKRDERSVKEHNAAMHESKPAPKLGSRIAARFQNTGLTADLPELRSQLTRSADFGK